MNACKKPRSDTIECGQDMNSCDTEALQAWRTALNERLSLSKEDTSRILADFDRAMAYYKKNGIPVEEAVSRLDPDRLHSFYRKENSRLFPLEYPARIYPFLGSGKLRTVFCLTAGLNEEVVPELLQIALLYVLRRFPTFAGSLRPGLFWHSLYLNPRHFAVAEKSTNPCSEQNMKLMPETNFRVFFSKKEILAEFSHVLTDGYGGMLFFDALLREYFRLLGIPVSLGKHSLPADEEMKEEELENVFQRQKPGRTHSEFHPFSLRPNLAIAETTPDRSVYFHMNADELKTAARARNTTVTIYVLGCLFQALKACTNKKNGRITVQIPVNLRNYIDTRTVRNASMFFTPSLALSEINGRQQMYERIKQQFESCAGKEETLHAAGNTALLVRAITPIPLFLKQFLIQLIYPVIGLSPYSAFFSNLGVLTLPEDMESLVEFIRTDMYCGNAAAAFASLAAWNKNAVLSLTENTSDSSLEQEMKRLFEKDGITPVLETDPG